MSMTYRASERISGIGLRHAFQFKQAHDHVLHLFFFGVTVANDRLFDLQRSIFVELEIAQHDRANRRTTRLPKHERRLRIDIDEDFLQCDLLRLIARNNFSQSIE